MCQPQRTPALTDKTPDAVGGSVVSFVCVFGYDVVRITYLTAVLTSDTEFLKPMSFPGQ